VQKIYQNSLLRQQTKGPSTMNSTTHRITFALSCAFILAVAWIYLLLAIAIVPYWQTLSGTEVQAWFAGPFVRFSYLMVPVHLLSIITTVAAYIMNRKGPHETLFLVAMVTLLICQAFNFTLFGANYNPALQSQSLTPDAALAVLDQWDFYHLVRTVSVCVSAITMMVITTKFMKVMSND
jgi:hypothetical protein